MTQEKRKDEGGDEPKAREARDLEPQGDVGEQILVNCRRTGELYDVREHTRCPYCYGTLSDVESGDHGRFCDFEPGRDPISFGFPDDSSRAQRS